MVNCLFCLQLNAEISGLETLKISLKVNVNIFIWQYTRAVPASATKADKKLKANALNTVNPDCNRTPKSPTC
jgi:hypothetical protein